MQGVKNSDITYVKNQLRVPTCSSFIVKTMQQHTAAASLLITSIKFPLLSPKSSRYAEVQRKLEVCSTGT